MPDFAVEKRHGCRVFRRSVLKGEEFIKVIFVKGDVAPNAVPVSLVTSLARWNQEGRVRLYEEDASREYMIARSGPLSTTVGAHTIGF